MQVEEALRHYGGVARWSGLRAFGVSERALRAAVGAERITAAGNGGYVLPGTDPALVAAVALCGVASHASAARLHGLDLHRPPQAIEVTVRRGVRQRMPGVRVYARDLASAARELSLPVTTVRRTLHDCARTMPLLDAVVLLDGALRARASSTADLRAMAQIGEWSGFGGATPRRGPR